MSKEFKTLKPCNRESGACVHTFSGHDGEVNACAFSPDGSYLLSSMADGTLRQWGLDGTELMTIYAFGSLWLSHNDKKSLHAFYRACLVVY